MRKLMIAAALCSIVWSVAQAEELKINKWPDDVPCDAIRKNPDGSYTQIKDIVLPGNKRISGNILKDSGETRLWDQKCAGKTAK
jgi:hypothetical protein